MKKFSKIFITAISALLIVLIVIGAITGDIHMLSPKVLSTVFKQTGNADFSVTFKDDETVPDDLSPVSFHYLDSSDDYDYYVAVLYTRTKKNRTCLVQMSEGNVLKKYDLSNSELFNDYFERESVYALCGTFRDGYLYFLLKGHGSIYRIDENLNQCELYYTPKKYGRVSPVSLNLCGDDLLYMTDTYCAVRFDGTQETKLCEAKPITEVFSSEDVVYTDELELDWPPEKSNYVVCSNGTVTYFAAKDKLFKCEKDGKFEEIQFNAIPKYQDYRSHFYNIEFSKENENILFITFNHYEQIEGLISVFPGIYNRKIVYVYNTKSQRALPFYQTTGNAIRQVTVEEFKADWNLFDVN